MDGVSNPSTTPRRNAHSIETRVVLYRWHPWHERAVYVVSTLEKIEPVFRCALEPGDRVRTIDIPQWMFDPAVCRRIEIVTSPSVSVTALRDLAQVYASVRGAEPRAMVEAEHSTTPDRGGAHAIPDGTAAERPARAVSAPANKSFVARSSSGSSRPGRAADRKAPARTPRAPVRRGRRSGGAR